MFLLQRKIKVLCCQKYIRYLQQTNSVLLSILSAIKQVDFHLSGTIISKVTSFAYMLFIHWLNHTAGTTGQQKIQQPERWNYAGVVARRVEHSMTRRSMSTNKLEIPMLRLQTSRKAFRYRAPFFWNTIDDIASKDSFYGFKSSLYSSDMFTPT